MRMKVIFIRSPHIPRLTGILAMLASAGLPVAWAEPPEDSPGEAGGSLVVYGTDPAEALRQSAYTVTVVETESAQRESGDLGAVLSRETPVVVQRTGGLGSRTSLSLGGLGGERLRVFVDGVPIEFMGFLAGAGNVPVNLIDRVEVYQGAVPIRLAGDALSGAVNLVTDQGDEVDGSRVAGSYQFGSFSTHRAALSARYAHLPSGLFAQVDGFYDVAANDYDVDVTAYNDVGQITDITAPLFHNGYQGQGATAGVGVKGRSWADALVARVFSSAFHNDVQNGVTMSRPYGEVSFDRETQGAYLTYAVGERGRTRLDATAGYAHLDALFTDLSSCIYDWYGVCTPRSVDTIQGEISGQPSETALVSDTVYLRSHVQRFLTPSQQLRLALALTRTDRTGEDRTRSVENDALSQPRLLSTGVLGVELASSVLDERLTNVVSVKGYALETDSQALLATGDWQDLSASLRELGGGDSVRLRLAPWAHLKASYERATRLPSVDELYGDGMLVVENLELLPETSDNVTAGAVVDGLSTRAGRVSGSVTGFTRWSDQLITRLASDEYIQNVNVWSARSQGFEARLGWAGPSERLFLDGSVTYQDVRNTSSEGPLADRAGDRIPNIPYLFGSASARLHGDGVIVSEDSVDLTLRPRYVDGFNLGWESLAVDADRLQVPSQLTLGASLVYTVRGPLRTFSASLDVENATDADTFDFYGLQRPGRAVFTKWTIQ